MIDAREKKTWFSMSFNEQMAQIDSEINYIIKYNSKPQIQEKGKEAYGEPGCASSIKELFEIIKADPKNQAVMREICQAERELIAFIYDEPNAPSQKEITAYWSRYLNAYAAEVQQSPSIYYLLVKASDSHDSKKSEVLGVYRGAGNLETAYNKAVRELEAEQKDSAEYKKIAINSFDEMTNVWQHDINPEKLFGAEHSEKESPGIIVECVMDSPYMFMWKLDNVVKDIRGYTYNDTLARALRHDESIFVRFDIENTYEVLDKFGWNWGGWNSCPDWETMRDKAKEWHERYDAELVYIAHDTLGFQCRKLTEKEAAEIITEGNSLTAEVINSDGKANKDLAGKNFFYLWWD